MSTVLRPDLQVIFDHIPVGTRLLDVGCGQGDLLAELRLQKQVNGRGLELDPVKVADAVQHGIPVVQGNADEDLAAYLSDSFDYAVMSQTLPALQHPAKALDELMRIAPRAFVTFPNFAHWRVRASLGFGGRMPVTKLLPQKWYDTPNIHHLTVDDFRALVKERGCQTIGSWFLSNGKLCSPTLANLLAEHAIFELARSSITS